MTDSNLPTRLIAHLCVASLVVAAALTGFSHAEPSAEGSADFLALVQRARGAANQLASVAPYSTEVSAIPDDEATLLDRSTRATLPQEAPMPTPVPVDPNATPLPGPEHRQQQQSAQPQQQQATSTGTAGVVPPAPTTRNIAPAPASALVWPVPVGSITQYFHAAHLALDIAAPYGATVVAAQGGTVTWAGWRNNGGGLVISIDHGNGMTTIYNHLGSLWVSVGQYVGAGQPIAGNGCTGMCTGNHVHFELVVNGVNTNPLRYY